MARLTINGKDINTYYNTQPSQDGKDHRVRLLVVSPYDGQETLNFFSKHLALPLIAIIILLFTLPFAFFFIGIFRIIIIILSLIASFFIINYIRVLIFKKRYKIKENEGLITKKSFPLNKGLLAPQPPATRHFKIGFVGDLMMMRDHDLQFDQPIKDFFDDVDIIVGNLEGILSIQPGPAVKQEHPDEILKQLINIFNNTNTKTEWLLSLSNNHSTDFGRANFNYSLNKIQLAPRINAFGRKDTPNVLINNDILITTASQWSNQKNWDYISKFDIKTNFPLETHNKFSAEKFNILYPHWGYENEGYVRTAIRKEAIRLLSGVKQKFSWIKRRTRKLFKKPKILEGTDKKWDLIFGHHSHVRQPIMKIRDGNIWKLVAFSGGNFASGVRIIRKKKHIYGIIMKCEIAPLARGNGKLVIGRVEWERTINKRTKNPRTKTVHIDLNKEKGFKILYLVIFVLIIVAILAIIGIQLFLNLKK